MLAASSDRRGVRRPVSAFGRWRMPQWLTGGALAASLALGFAVGYAGEPPQSSDTDYASMLTVSGAGAGSMFFTAMNDPER